MSEIQKYIIYKSPFLTNIDLQNSLKYFTIILKQYSNSLENPINLEFYGDKNLKMRMFFAFYTERINIPLR